MKTNNDAIAKALYDTLISPNEYDRNQEAANIVDGLFVVARALNRVAKAIEGADRPTVDKQ